jgi:hypothetical protein
LVGSKATDRLYVRQNRKEQDGHNVEDAEKSQGGLATDIVYVSEFACFFEIPPYLSSV